MNILLWLKAMRLPFLTGTLVPVVLGTAIAWNMTGAVNWKLFLLVLIGVSFAHIGANMTNDFFDHKTTNDENNKYYSQFSGGSRVIQDGLIAPQKVLAVALLTLIGASVIGLYLVWTLKSFFVLFLGIIGVAIAYSYTALPFKLGYRGFGELIVGFCFGPLTVVGAYYVQAKEFDMMPLWASVPVGIWIALVLYINEFPDKDADESVNKKTLVVRLGKQKGIKVYHLFLWLTYIYVVAGVLAGYFTPYLLVILLTLPIALKAYMTSKVNFSKIAELRPANAMTIVLHLLVGLLLSMGFILDRII